MTIQKNVVLWDNGRDRLCILRVPFEQQYKYIDGVPCITFGISYESTIYKGYDVFTLFDHFYSDIVSAIKKHIVLLMGLFVLMMPVLIRTDISISILRMVGCA